MRVIVLIVLLALPQCAWASSPVLILSADEARTFQEARPALVGRQMEIPGQGEQMTVLYSADAPIELAVSVLQEKNDAVQFNPIHTLTLRKLSVGKGKEAILDLSRSPAWSPWHRGYLLHMRGPVGTNIAIHDITLKTPSLGTVISAFWRHLMVDEPVLMSSINALWGYYVLGVSATFLLGCALIIAVAIAWRWGCRAVCLVMLVIVLLYDARLGVDLLRVSAADLTEWAWQRNYRQYGPLFSMADRIKSEETIEMGGVVLCFDTEDAVLKQLKYLLYPIPVEQGSDAWARATHAAILGTEQGRVEDGMASCRDAPARPAEIVEFWPLGSFVLRFTD